MSRSRKQWKAEARYWRGRFKRARARHEDECDELRIRIDRQADRIATLRAGSGASTREDEGLSVEPLADGSASDEVAPSPDSVAPFEVGERVRCTQMSEDFAHLNGREGSVIEVDPLGKDGPVIGVRLDRDDNDDEKLWAMAWRFERVPLGPQPRDACDSCRKPSEVTKCATDGADMWLCLSCAATLTGGWKAHVLTLRQERDQLLAQPAPSYSDEQWEAAAAKVRDTEMRQHGYVNWRPWPDLSAEKRGQFVEAFQAGVAALHENGNPR